MRARLRRRLIIPVGILALIGIVALFAPAIASKRGIVPFDPDQVSLAERFDSPSARHLLGTDEVGRDLLARIIHGSRVSLLVGLGAATLSLGLGSLLGALAGLLGGITDWVVSRVIEVAISFPFFFLALGVAALFEPSTVAVVAALAAVGWPSDARIVRGEVLRLRSSDLAAAARAVGASRVRVAIRHLLPNAIGPAVATSAFGVASAIAAESALSFLGLGVQPPTASWGTILATADDYLRSAWWLAVFPGLAVFVTVAACNELGEAARDALDPASQRHQDRV